MALCLLLLVAALGLRVWGIDRDPPSVDLLPDEGAWTDEGSLSLASMETIRGLGPAGEGGALLVANHPIYQGLLYGTFRLFGVGRVQGRALALAFGFAGLAALAALANSLWYRKGALLALLFAGSGFLFIMYDHLLLTEGILTALMSLIALMGLRSKRPWSAAAVGIALGLVAVGVKLHALALVPALIVLYALRRKRLLLPFLIGTGAVLMLWRVYWFAQAPSIDSYLATRFAEPQMGMAPLPLILLHIVLAGLPGYFSTYQLPLLLFATLEVLALLLAPWRWLRETPDVVLLALVWLPVSIAGASILLYMPTRYFMPAAPALVILAIAGVRRLVEGPAFEQRSMPWRLAIGVVLGLFLWFQVAPPLPLFGSWAFMVPLFGFPAPVAVYWLTTRTEPGLGLSPRVRSGIVVALVSVFVMMQAGLYWFGIVQARQELSQAAQALAQTLPPDAIITGRLASTMALLAPVRGEHHFTLLDRDYVASLAKHGPVRLLVLQGDENLIDPAIRPFTQLETTYAVNFSRKVQFLGVYRFDAQ